MTLHRRNPPCASCHKIMDPIGFALENFDADGKWRTKHGGDGGRQSMRRPNFSTASRSMDPSGEAGAAAVFSAVRPDVDGKDDDIRARPRRGILRHAGDPRDRAGRGARTTTDSRPSCSASSRARRFRWMKAEESSTSRAIAGTSNRSSDSRSRRSDNVHHQETYSSPYISARRWSDVALPLLESMLPALTPCN